MSVKDHKVQAGQGIGGKIIPIVYAGTIPADQSDIELLSFRLPSITDWLILNAYIWCKSTTGSNAKTVNLEDDGAALGTHTTVVAGSQTAITGVSNESVAGGSEVQVNVTTGGTTTITDLVVTIHIEPLYMYGRLATPAPS